MKLVKYKDRDFIESKIGDETYNLTYFEGSYLTTANCSICGMPAIEIDRELLKKDELSYQLIPDDVFGNAKQCPDCLTNGRMTIYHSNCLKEISNNECPHCKERNYLTSGGKELSNVNELLKVLDNVNPCMALPNYNGRIEFTTETLEDKIIMPKELVIGLRNRILKMNNDLINKGLTDDIYEVRGSFYHKNGTITGVKLYENPLGLSTLNDNINSAIDFITNNSIFNQLSILLGKYSGNNEEIPKIKEYLKAEHVSEKNKREILFLLARKMAFNSEQIFYEWGKTNGEEIRVHSHPKDSTRGPSIHDVTGDILQGIISLHDKQLTLTFTRSAGEKFYILENEKTTFGPSARKVDKNEAILANQEMYKEKQKGKKGLLEF
ncbi:MAG TPA: hypothetical protein VI790_04045 [Candidatus Nanoarchaeia archaeon]|nr:hypothetical protein [Candidatus Nanoarchaeia archaeon]